MRKTKPKTSKAKSTYRKTPKGFSNALYATEHDFIIIAGGAVVVLMLTIFLFLG